MNRTDMQTTPPDLRARLVGLRDKLVRYLERVCKRRGSGLRGLDDLAQRTYAAGLSSLPTYREEQGELGRWMFGVATNVERQAARERRMHAAQFAPDEGDVESAVSELPSPERITHARAMLARIAVAIAEMPLPLFAVFQRVAIDKASHEEAAATLGISVANSKKRLERARIFIEERAEIQREDIHTVLPLLVFGTKLSGLPRARWRGFYEVSARGGHLVAALLAGLFLWSTTPLSKVRAEAKADLVEAPPTQAEQIAPAPSSSAAPAHPTTPGGSAPTNPSRRRKPEAPLFFSIEATTPGDEKGSSR